MRFISILFVAMTSFSTLAFADIEFVTQADKNGADTLRYDQRQYPWPTIIQIHSVKQTDVGFSLLDKKGNERILIHFMLVPDTKGGGSLDLRLIQYKVTGFSNNEGDYQRDSKTEVFGLSEEESGRLLKILASTDASRPARIMIRSNEGQQDHGQILKVAH